MSFSSEVLSIERKGAVGTLWLDRPEKRNAMNSTMWTTFPEAIASLTEDGEVRAIVLAGKGKSFCVGLDLMALQSGGEIGGALSGAEANLKQLEVTRGFQRSITAIAEAPVPVICAIHGHCLGGGVDIATACDIRLAANAPLAVRGTKFVLSQSEDLTTEQSLLLNGIWTMITTLNSNDLKEAMSAFMEKRAPTFKGN